MKTKYKSALFIGVLLVVVFFGIINNAAAQSIHDEILTTEKRVELGAINSNAINHLNKLILIYDSTSLTIEFTENGELAVITTCATLNSSASDNPNVKKKSSKKSLSEEYIQSIMKEATNDAVDEEMELRIMDWMIHPEDWTVN